MVNGMHYGTSKAAASATPSVFGILYAEDFDAPLELHPDPSTERVTEPPAPVITKADVDAACAAAVRAARADWQHSNEQMRLDAIASLRADLVRIRDAGEQSANAVAEGTVTTILSMINGLLPHFSREHGAAEVRALLGALLPTIRSQTRIKIRVNANLVASLQHDVAELEPDLAALIDISGAQLEPGDVKVNWENGSMTRDTRQIMQAITDVLGQLGLQQPVEAPSKKRMAYAE